MLASVKFTGGDLAGLIVAISFAAGLNLYATVASLGLMAHAGWVDLPPGLHLLESWWVIGAAGALFAIEFFADKIPAFDLVWNALHTFVRVPAAALMAYGATMQLSPAKQALAMLVGGGIAMAAHGGKTAARVAVMPSPEPFSRIAMSTGEDTTAVLLTWFAIMHPILAGSVVVVFLVAIVIVIRAVMRAIWRLFHRHHGRVAPAKRSLTAA